MWKILLILSLPPLLASIVCAHFFGQRAIGRRADRELPITAHSLLERLLKVTESTNSGLEIRTRLGLSRFEDDRLILTQVEAEEQTVSGLGKAVWLAGLRQVHEQTPQLVKWWQSARTFGQIVVPFVWVLAVLAAFALRMSSAVALSLAIGAVGLSCVLCLAQIPMHLQAVRYGRQLLERARVFNRLDDEEAVMMSAKGWAFSEALPVCLNFLVVSRKRTGKPRLPGPA